MNNLLRMDISEHTRTQLRNPFAKIEALWTGSWANLSRAEWLRHIRARLKALVEMPAGWDGYGAPKIAADTVLFVQQILMDAWTMHLSPPQISAMSNGALMAEFRQHGYELTIEIFGPYESIFSLERPDGSEENGTIGADMTGLRTIIVEMVTADNVVAFVA